MAWRDVQAGGGGWAGALARPALTALAGGWWTAQALKSAAYASGLRRPARLPIPVISVGNLTAGGTGKTPFVGWLVERLRAAGRTPGVLARGYGPRTESGLSDEGAVLEVLLGPRLPQVEDPARVRGGRRLLSEHPAVDVLVLDDGFQHRRLHRDLDLVLLDATNPFGFGHLLPRGLLRERPRALARAHAVVLTRADQVPATALEALRSEVGRYTQAPVATARTVPVALQVGTQRLDPSALRDQPVVALSGIGNPAAFESTLERLGARLVGTYRLADHAVAQPVDWNEARQVAARAGARWVVVTRKDAVKGLPPDVPVAVLDIATEVTDGADRLWQAVASAISVPSSCT